MLGKRHRRQTPNVRRDLGRWQRRGPGDQGRRFPVARWRGRRSPARPGRPQGRRHGAKGTPRDACVRGGSLDRALIEKVVNEHTDEIQRCYEKELLHDPGQQGKVQVEWIIGLDGGVPSVRQMFSSVRSVNVVKCIMDSIKTWKFPHPQGGQVVVNYPFIIKGIDF